jgi:preprotein translocase subunit SecB
MADEQTPSEKQLLLQGIYIKDFSFESPKAPEIFTSNVNAQTLLNIRSATREIGADRVEVTLALKVKSVAPDDDTVFLVELVQAGIFTIKGYTPEERFALLGSACPGMLYPFAREAVADVAIKGGFPQLLLQPLDFGAMYAQNMQERAAQAAQVPGKSR